MQNSYTIPTSTHKNGKGKHLLLTQAPLHLEMERECFWIKEGEKERAKEYHFFEACTKSSGLLMVVLNALNETSIDEGEAKMSYL